MKNEEINPIKEWVDSDTELAKTLVEIEGTNLSLAEQADIAFHKISDMYGVPKIPEDIVYNDEDDNTEEYVEKPSVYEILGQIKYLQPGDDPRAQVLSAIYYVKNGYGIDLADVLKRKFGKKIPANTSVGFIREGINVELMFLDGSKNWMELGCKLMLKSV
jgi:hypothetical protein